MLPLGTAACHARYNPFAALKAADPPGGMVM
jgi:hypothetical protein